MTNEEYIRWLKLLDDELTFDALVDGKDEMDMHEMIFGLCEKLEQEPCEDCISRQAVLDGLASIAKAKAKSDAQKSLMGRIMFFVEQLQSVQPKVEQEPKSGHWKVVSDGYGDNSYICECSECADTVWVYKDADRKWNYCPNCGAKMESEG